MTEPTSPGPAPGSGATATRPTVLVVARDGDYRMILAAALDARGFTVFHTFEHADAASTLGSLRPDAIVVDVQATGVFTPLAGYEDVPVVILASKPTESVLRTLQARAADVLTKPVSLERLGDAIALAIEATGRVGTYRKPLGNRFTSRSPVMRRLLAQVERLRDADCSVLILGETGTGKTVLARQIHAIGARSDAPFVDLNCAGLTTELVESELFGHERGAFTGAHAAKQGLFDTADGGTMFLDEIGDIDVRVQPRILKVLEEKRFRRIGDVRERAVDVRLLAATNVDLLEAVARKTFRADLYYRISTIRLVVPPLRERREDIIPLVVEMLDRVGEPQVTLSRDAEQRLLEYAWPGNIRELKNVVESSTLLRGDVGSVLTADDLRFDVYSPASSHHFVAAPPPSVVTVVAETASIASVPSTKIAAASQVAAPASAKAAVANDAPPSSNEGGRKLLAAGASGATSAEIEREHIRLALAAEGGRVEAAARRLGIPRSTLYWKLKRFGLRPNGEESRPRAAPRASDSSPDALDS